MATHWKIFTGGENRRKKGLMSISLGRKGVIRMNLAAIKAIGEPEAVVLMFDDKESIIGIVPSTLRNDISFTVPPRPSMWLIHAAPFCRDSGISMDKTER